MLGQLVTVDLRTLRFGGFSFSGAEEGAAERLKFISPATVSAGDVVVDLRSSIEAPVSPFTSALRFELNELEANSMLLPQDSRIVLCCRTGVRAWRAARVLQRMGRSHLALIAFNE
jgi:rhodanese-related sulfurtransferase